ncbi:MAG: hypothetical protein KDK90_25370 [Leptospiraceae bacterium]|nr:hypothetical protein [Leptospiraceae bacterium]
MSKAKELLEAHVKFELQNLSGEKLTQNIETELNLLYEWLDIIPLEDIITQDKLIDLVQNGVKEYPLKEETFQIIQRGAHRIHKTLANSSTQFESVISREDFNKLFKVFLGMQDLRRDITSTIIHSPAYSKLISEVLYTSIKDFVINENIFAKKVPGASSLFKLGQDFLNMTGMEDGMDKKLTQFIHDNIQDTIKQSEKFMDREFDKQLPDQIIEETWQFLSQHKSSKFAEYVSEKDIDALILIFKNSVSKNQKNPILQEILKDLIEDFFTNYKGKSVGFILCEFGFSKENHIPEIAKAATSILEKPPVKEYIEKRLRARLEVFYNSKEASNIMS